MLPQDLCGGEKTLTSHNLLMTAFQIKKGGKRENEMQLLDGKEELRVNNR